LLISLTIILLNQSRPEVLNSDLLILKKVMAETLLLIQKMIIYWFVLLEL